MYALLVEGESEEEMDREEEEEEGRRKEEEMVDLVVLELSRASLETEPLLDRKREDGTMVL